jgi:hypothetical protein
VETPAPLTLLEKIKSQESTTTRRVIWEQRSGYAQDKKIQEKRLDATMHYM